MRVLGRTLMVGEEAASVCVPRGSAMHTALCPGVSEGVVPTPLALRVLTEEELKIHTQKPQGARKHQGCWVSGRRVALGSWVLRVN